MISTKLRKKWAIGIIAWLVAVIIFFPVFWMILTSFKTETEAISRLPHLFFAPTLANYVLSTGASKLLSFCVEQRSRFIRFHAGGNRGCSSVRLLDGFSCRPSVLKTTLLWMWSTKMMPSVGVLVPVYLIFRDLGLLDTLTGLLILDALLNLPIVVWMLYTFFKEVPKEVLEAARMDGAGPLREIYNLLLPLSLPGIVSTSLLAVILSWNEAFWSLTLTAAKAAPLTAFIASFSSPEGLFYAKLSAASTMAIAPILILGWASQRQLVRGLTFGAVK